MWQRGSWGKWCFAVQDYVDPWYLLPWETKSGGSVATILFLDGDDKENQLKKEGSRCLGKKRNNPVVRAVLFASLASSMNCEQFLAFLTEDPLSEMHLIH